MAGSPTVSHTTTSPRIPGLLFKDAVLVTWSHQGKFLYLKCFSTLIINIKRFRVPKVKSAAPDTETKKLYSWPVYRDPKGTKKIQVVYEVKLTPASVEKPKGRKKKEVCVEIFFAEARQQKRLL